MVPSDGLIKHSILLLWKILEMKKTSLFLFYQKCCIILKKEKYICFTLECHSRVLGLFVTQFCDTVTCLVFRVLDLPPLPPKSKNTRVRVLTQSNMIILLQKLTDVMFSTLKLNNVYCETLSSKFTVQFVYRQ